MDNTGLPGSWIMGCRNKTGVYGEWKLWPETVRALEWWQANRPAMTTPYLLTTEDGECFFKNPRNKLVYKSWRKLLEKVRKREPGFRYLPRKRLKSTAIDLVRQAGDGYAALIVDDLGYVQQSRDEMEVLFTLLTERYERGSVLLTSNLPFSGWEAIFKDPMTTAAAIDRLVHHSVIIELNVPSYRAEQARKAKQGRAGDPAGATPSS